MPVWSIPQKFYAEARENCVTWAKQFGYLRAPREGGKGSRWDEWVSANNTAPAMPDLGSMGFVADLFVKSGRYMRGGSEIAPLTYQEIEAFARVEIGIGVDDMRLIRAMSVAFVDWLAFGRDVFCAPPWDEA